MVRSELLTLRSVLADILSYNRRIAAEGLNPACPQCGSRFAVLDPAGDRRVAVPAGEPCFDRDCQRD